jgi:hypothetical protein
MEEAQVPNWIARAERIKNERRLKEGRDQERSRAVDAVLQTGKGDYWTFLKGQLTFAAAALERVGIKASVFDISQPEFKNNQMRIILAGGFPDLRQSYVDVRYAEGDKCVRCYPCDDREYDFDFVVTDQNRVGLFCSWLGRVLGPNETAEEILKPLARTVLPNVVFS